MAAAAPTTRITWNKLSFEIPTGDSSNEIKFAPKTKIVNAKGNKVVMIGAARTRQTVYVKTWHGITFSVLKNPDEAARIAHNFGDLTTHNYINIENVRALAKQILIFHADNEVCKAAIGESYTLPDGYTCPVGEFHAENKEMCDLLALYNFKMRAAVRHPLQKAIVELLFLEIHTLFSVDGLNRTIDNFNKLIDSFDITRNPVAIIGISVSAAGGAGVASPTLPATTTFASVAQTPVTISTSAAPSMSSTT